MNTLQPRTPEAVEPSLRIERDGGLLLIAIDHPPVNALSQRVRAELLDALRRAEADTSIRAIVLLGSDGRFSAGADIREFGQARRAPSLSELCDAIESCPKPVVAAIDGSALGGGLELALAAHYRVATARAMLGLPEVRLGLLPGAGGTQRLPRLIGALAALAVMLEGKPISAPQALAQGLVDRIGDHPRRDGAAYARELLAMGAGPRRSRDATALIKDPAMQLASIEAARGELPRKYRDLFAPQCIVDCVEAALKGSFAKGCQAEHDRFRRCLANPQHQALRHAFLAERAAAKVPEAAAAPPRTCERASVIGGGTMGAGIAVALLDAGLSVVMIERDVQAIEAGRDRVQGIYAAQLARGRLSEQARDDRLQRFAGSVDFAALADADLVVEAIYENLAAKQAVFAELDRVCKPGAVLGTNTSYLDIDAIASATSRPQDVIGLHFFSPAQVMRLLEIVVPPRAAADAVATGFALAKRLGKIAVRAGVCDGFIGNRLMSVYRRCAEAMLEDGASPYQIDAALREFGFAMGPFQISDLAGGDIAWAARQRRAAHRDPRERYVRVADCLYERGWLGCKSGRGWYRYEQGKRDGHPDPEVLAIVDAERRRAGITPRDFSDVQIVHRYLCAMINEGANAVHEGIALRPLDVDVVLLNGYGFPRHRGGPMHCADALGLEQVLHDMHAFAVEDPLFWRPSPLLASLVAHGGAFADLNSR
jgi:3-hydroxyacyl-CoA dehydrogenase